MDNFVLSDYNQKIQQLTAHAHVDINIQPNSKVHDSNEVIDKEVHIEDIEGENDDDEEGEEEEEMPEEFKLIDPSTRTFWILLESLKIMGFGTIVVLVFSDPMVEVLNQLGIVTGIGSF